MRLWKISTIVPLLALPLATGAVIALPAAASAASCATVSFTNPYLGFADDVPAATLGEGSAGSCVVMLQQDLNFTINAKLKVDGAFGPNTLAAVKSYQARNLGCTGGADGLAGHYTMSCLVASSG